MRREGRGLSILWFLLLLVWIPSASSGARPAYGLLGYSGAVLSPTAQTVPDARLSLGVGYLPAQFAVLRRPRFGDKIYSLTLGYLPFLETTWGILRSDHIGNRWGIGDRFAFFRFQLHAETSRWPAVVLGLHDPFGIVGEEWAQHLCASYVVLSRRRTILHRTCLFSVGYGSDKIPAAQHQLVGLFGSVILEARKNVSLILENDAEKFNAALRVQWRRIELDLALLGMRAWAGRLSADFSLRPDLPVHEPSPPNSAWETRPDSR